VFATALLTARPDPCSRTTENSTRTSPTLWRRCWPARSQLLQVLRLRPRQRTQRLSSNKRNEQDGPSRAALSVKGAVAVSDGPVAHCGPSNRHSVPPPRPALVITGVHDLPDLSSVRHQFLQLAHLPRSVGPVRRLVELHAIFHDPVIRTAAFNSFSSSSSPCRSKWRLASSRGSAD